MPSRPQIFKSLIAITLFAGCNATVEGQTKEGGDNDDVSDALAQYPEAQVIEWTADGLPMYIVGEMMKVGAMQSDDPIASDAALRPAVAPVLKAFRLDAAD